MILDGVKFGDKGAVSVPTLEHVRLIFLVCAGTDIADWVGYIFKETVEPYIFTHCHSINYWLQVLVENEVKFQVSLYTKVVYLSFGFMQFRLTNMSQGVNAFKLYRFLKELGYEQTNIQGAIKELRKFVTEGDERLLDKIVLKLPGAVV